LLEPIEPVQRKTEYYKVVRQQLPPEPVYSRLTWSQLPAPAVACHSCEAKEKAPLLQPVIQFNLAKSNLAEALEAVSQTIGYRLEFPAKWSKRPISINFTGTVEQALAEIAQQAGVRASLDHELRLVKVVDKKVTPYLPPAAKF